MKKPLIIGSIYTQVTAEVDKLPKGNEDFQPLSLSQSLSGTGYHMAVFMHKLSLPYELLAPVGTGIYGEYVVEKMNEAGMHLPVSRDELNGCTYYLADQHGNETAFMMPGAEYEFRIEDAYDLYPGELDCILLGDEMLMGEDVDDLLRMIEDLDKPVYMHMTGRAGSLDEDILEAVYALNPVIQISDTDAYELLQGKAEGMEEAAALLRQKTGSPVLITQKNTGVYFLDEESFVESHKKPVNTSVHLCAYALAVSSGADEKNALAFANEAASAYCRGNTLTAFDQELLKRKLTEMIIHG